MFLTKIIGIYHIDEDVLIYAICILVIIYL